MRAMPQQRGLITATRGLLASSPGTLLHYPAVPPEACGARSIDPTQPVGSPTPRALRAWGARPAEGTTTDTSNRVFGTSTSAAGGSGGSTTGHHRPDESCTIRGDNARGSLETSRAGPAPQMGSVHARLVNDRSPDASPAAPSMQAGVPSRAHTQNAQRLEQPRTEQSPVPTVMSGHTRNVLRLDEPRDDESPFLTPMSSADNARAGTLRNDIGTNEPVNRETGRQRENTPDTETEEEQNTRFQREWDAEMAAARPPEVPPPEPPPVRVYPGPAPPRSQRNGRGRKNKKASLKGTG
ncbi:hypothetical protein B0H17DRAFT_1139264 [Mycena rosella]|uniref:Uncharacterized protein n=1 Tax=Mycena rosella TaxID=1033263 RepID=A0AAD7D564_MYCRO|nr:hypothetical protein B0H17DRAFT_1139264 [Mycena rosella]